MNKKFIWIVVLILVIIAGGVFYFLYGGRPQTKNTTTYNLQFSASYKYAAEATYQEININQSKLTYTYFEDTNNKCANWIQQSPCWGNKDLITKDINLSEKEISDLIDLVKQTDFMNLDNTYGGASEYQRYYPYELTVSLDGKTKEVIYQSFPGATSMPKAFEEVKKALSDLVDKIK